MEKNSRFAVHSDASFALRGFLSGTSQYTRMDGIHQKLPSLELPMGSRTLNGYSILPEAQHRISTHRSRAIHASRTLSEVTRGVPSNRPLSPHIPIKKPQFGATFSISHRIFGASLASAILLIPIAWKFSVLVEV